MARNPKDSDVKAKAKAMLDAWQQAVTDQLTDPSALHAWLSMMQPAKEKENDATTVRKQPIHQQPIRKQSGKHAVSPDAGNDAIAAILKQLRKLEQRILALELAVAAGTKAKKPHGNLARPTAKTGGKPSAASRAGSTPRKTNTRKPKRR